MKKSKIDTDLSLAIEWIAAEYKYVTELKEELALIEREKKPSEEIKEINKAISIFCYIGGAEKRAHAFETRVNKDLKQIYAELSEHLDFDLTLKHDLLKRLRKLSEKLNVGEYILVGQASAYRGAIKKELDEVKAKIYFKKQYGEHNHLFSEIDKIKKQVADIETWLEGLEATLQDAKKFLEDLKKSEKEAISKRGRAILLSYEFPMMRDEKFTNFLAMHPSDLSDIAISRDNSGYFFSHIISSYKGIINDDTWDVLTKMFKNANSYGLSYQYKFTPDIIAEVQKGISSDDFASLLEKIYAARVHEIFTIPEVFAFFIFMKRCVNTIKKEKIEIVYAIDCSGRILGVLLSTVLRRLKLSKLVKFYFLHGTRGGEATFYSEKQKKEIKGKNVLVMDEYVSSGSTITYVKQSLKKYVGKKGNIILFSFGEGLGNYSSAIKWCPSFYGNEMFSGMKEKEEGGVYINEDIISRTREIRQTLTKFGKIIGDYLKETGD
jgi:hypothetical protein